MSQYSFFEGIVFFALATISVISSLMVVLKKNSVSSAFSLILVLFSFAGIFALLKAHAMAAFQILVYAGAIMVLFVFVIMLLNQGSDDLTLEENSESVTPIFKVFSAIVATAFSGVLFYLFKNIHLIRLSQNMTDQGMEEGTDNFLKLSETLFTRYVYHFEIISILILTAVICTLAMTRGKPEKNTKKETR